MSVNEGLLRYGGMYGAAYGPSGNVLAEVVEVTAAVEVNRIEVPLVGTTKQGYKTGRETREGTINIQKIDSKWEMELFRFLSQGLEARRRARDTGDHTMLRPFNLVIGFDDPDALGREKWLLEGCLLWRMTIGFSITDDIVNREFPLTWEHETPLEAFVRGPDVDGFPTAQKVYSGGSAVVGSPTTFP